jgi:hypothetical protein
MSHSGSVARLAAMSAAAVLLLTIVIPQPVVAREPDRVRHTLPRPPADLARVLRGGLASVAAEPATEAAAEPAAEPATDGRRGTVAGSRASLAGMITDAGPTGTRVAVSITAEAGQADHVSRAVEALGGDLANRLDPIIEAYVPVAALADLARVVGIRSVEPIGVRAAHATLADAAALHGAPAWTASGFTGAGVKIGIIDSGFMGLSTRLGSSLPAQVHGRCYSAAGTFSDSLSACERDSSHGTAVAESAFSTAAGAELYVANPVSSLDDRATVEWMTANGVRIINASWTYQKFHGPGDGTSPRPDSIYATIDRAVAGGALWVNSAGNQGLSGWAGPWLDADGDRWLEFDGSDESNRVQLWSGDTIGVALRWADPWGASTNDYDVCIYEADGVDPLACGDDPQTAAANPTEFFSFEAPFAGTYDISVRRAAGQPTSRMQLLVYEADLQYRVPDGTLPSGPDSRNAGMLAVGAVDVASPNVIEPYSSRGPTVDGRVKPDLVAGDCATTATEPEGFCGTSQSAPFVSGVAALVVQANPTFTPQQVAAWMKSHATPLGSPVPNNTFGSGRLNLGAAPTGEPGGPGEPGEPPPPSPALELAFQQQPVGGNAGAALPLQPMVKVTNDQGQPVTSRPGSDIWVELAIGTNGGGGGLSCTGGTWAQATAGVATFSGCFITAPGNGYTLVAISPDAAEATTQPFSVGTSVALAPATIISASSTSVPYGQGVTFGVQVASGGVAVAGQLVEIQYSWDGVGWDLLGGAPLDTAGIGAIIGRPSFTSYWRAVFPGAPGLAASISEPVRIKVAQSITLKPSNAGKTKVVRKGASVTFTAAVRPAWEDPKAKVSFLFYRKVGSAWKLTARKDRYASASGVAKLTWKFTTTGQWQVRVVANRTILNEVSAPSPVQRYDVK